MLMLHRTSKVGNARARDHVLLLFGVPVSTVTLGHSATSWGVAGTLETETVRRLAALFGASVVGRRCGCDLGWVKK